MFWNYFRIAIRNYQRQPAYTLINVFGLALGMACAILILFWVQDELSYDNYHTKADRTYRVAGSFALSGLDFELATVPAPMAAVLLSEYPEVEKVVRFRNRGSSIVRYGEHSYKEENFIYADSSFFDVFSIPLISGTAMDALSEPNTIVISETTAEKYFKDEDAVGKTVVLDNEHNYLVTGVFGDIPHNTHFQFDLIASLETLDEGREQVWLSNNFNTYIVLVENADPAGLTAKFPELIEKYLGPDIERFMGMTLAEVSEDGGRAGFYLQPLKSIHLHSDLMAEMGPNSDIRYIYIFSIIALVILLIACINFMNLSTARSQGRAKEIGVRKVVGAIRRQLILQFLGESIMLTIIAFILAIVIVQLSLPYFNILSDKEIVFMLNDSGTLLTLMLVVLFTGLISGSYPSFYLSAFQPVKVLKGVGESGKKKAYLRSALVVVQFMATVMLIIGTMIVFEQLNYISNKKIGFDKEHILILNNAFLLDEQVETFKDEVLQHPQLLSATISSYLPVPSSRNSSSSFEKGREDRIIILQQWRVDHDYIKTLGMNIVEGRDFSEEFKTDTAALILNQAAVTHYGWDEPVGKIISRFVSNTGDTREYKVIGVVEDFHFESLRENISPLLMYLGESGEMISFRVMAGGSVGALKIIEDKWAEYLPYQPFEYGFLDSSFDKIYRAERRIGSIVQIFAILAIFIGCLGLFGLSSFLAEKRTKEVGIRKVHGAAVTNIVLMLSKDITKWVLLSYLIATPLAYLIMDRWLDDFAYRITIHWTILVEAGLITLTIALLTVAYQAYRAAIRNPIDSLRSE